MNLPSIKMLEQICQKAELPPREAAKAVRMALEESRDWVESQLHPEPWHHRASTSHLRMLLISEITGCYGVEHVERGRNLKSPAFEYVNTGDSYAPTLVRFENGRYTVSSWGDIVERGNYE